MLLIGFPNKCNLNIFFKFEQLGIKQAYVQAKCCGDVNGGVSIQRQIHEQNLERKNTYVDIYWAYLSIQQRTSF